MRTSLRNGCSRTSGLLFLTSDTPVCLPVLLVIILDCWSRLRHRSIYLSKLSLIFDERLNINSSRFHSATVDVFLLWRPQAAFQTAFLDIVRVRHRMHFAPRPCPRLLLET